MSRSFRSMGRHDQWLINALAFFMVGENFGMDCEKCPVKEECKVYFDYFHECPLAKSIWTTFIEDIAVKAKREGKLPELRRAIEEATSAID